MAVSSEYANFNSESLNIPDFKASSTVLKSLYLFWQKSGLKVSIRRSGVSQWANKIPRK